MPFTPEEEEVLTEHFPYELDMLNAGFVIAGLSPTCPARRHCNCA
jgi:hypothetical protein